MTSPRRVSGSGISRIAPAPADTFRPYRWSGAAEQDGPSPQEIIADLHAVIAAKSPEHAALVAEFERRQAARQQS